MSHPRHDNGAGRANDRPALRRCLGADGVDARDFADRYWGREPLLSTGADGNGFADLMTYTGADELLSRHGLRTPFVRVAKQGRVLGDAEFAGPGGIGADVADQILDDRIARLFADGHTVVLQALHRTWPALIDFTGQLARDLAHPVQVNAYLTPAQEQGFSAHYDLHDVFVLQFHGEKRWRIHAPVFADPLRSQPWSERAEAVAAAAQHTEPVLDVVLRPGDSLYLPRGYLHAAEALGGVTGHLTVGIHNRTRYQLLDALLSAAKQRPDIRRSLPLGFDPGDPEQFDTEWTAAAASLRGLLADLDPAELAAVYRRGRLQANRPDPVAPLAHALAINALDDDDRVALRPGVDLLVEDGPDEHHLLVRLGRRRVTLPRRDAAAMELVADGNDVAVRELPGLAPAERLEFARTLLTEGVLVITSSGANGTDG